MKQNVTDMKITDLVQSWLKVFLIKDLFLRLTEVFFLYLLLLVKKMPPESRLQSYAPDVVKGKAILFTFLASFLAAYKGQRKLFSFLRVLFFYSTRCGSE